MLNNPPISYQIMTSKRTGSGRWWLSSMKSAEIYAAAHHDAQPMFLSGNLQPLYVTIAL